jgi:FtsP/CotA-like multicopper oxidase with cupredoxin domain
VEADANYVKPFTVQTLVISPGQTMNVLLTTAANPASTAYAMAISPYTIVRPDAGRRRQETPAAGPPALQRHPRGDQLLP